MTGYLTGLNKEQIYNLGLVLGLSYHYVIDLRDNCSSNVQFLDAVVAGWLQKKDKVRDVSWKSLIKALQNERLGQNGIAERIATEHSKTDTCILI